jgi:voltage-gated potassium channel
MKRIHHLPRKYITILRHGTESIQELLIVYLCTVLLCATIFSITEHQGEFNSIWWAFVTALTIGYGDFYPHTVVGKIDAVLLMHLVTLFILPIVIARMANKIVKDKDKFTLEEREEIKTILRKLDKR